MTEADLKKVIAAQGLVLRDEDAAATLATARFLIEAARRVQGAAR
ncbi:MAG: hypothetical protein ACT4OK_19970 [Gemmobacter sp.]